MTKKSYETEGFIKGFQSGKNQNESLLETSERHRKKQQEKEQEEKQKEEEKEKARQQRDEEAKGKVEKQKRFFKQAMDKLEKGEIPIDDDKYWKPLEEERKASSEAIEDMTDNEFMYFAEGNRLSENLRDKRMAMLQNKEDLETIDEAKQERSAKKEKEDMTDEEWSAYLKKKKQKEK